jgi:hypothetical protein
MTWYGDGAVVARLDFSADLLRLSVEFSVESSNVDFNLFRLRLQFQKNYQQRGETRFRPNSWLYSYWDPCLIN